MVMFGLIVSNLKRVLSVVTCFLPQSHTCLEIEMASASSTLNTLEVKPSPRSLASQHLQAKIYLTPLVGTATDSSSTSQQLSGVAPSWPSCREAEKQSLRATWVYFSAGPCVYVNVTETLNAWLPPHPSLTSTFLISPTSEPWDLKLSREPASKPCTPSGRSSHNLSVWVWLAPMMITKALLVVLASRSKPVQMVTWYGMTAQEGDDT